MTFLEASRRVVPHSGLLLAGFLLACGGRGGSLPEPPPCEDLQGPEPATAEAYLDAVADGKGAVQRPAFEFLTRWPSRKYSRRQMFREELASAADASICAARRLRSLAPPMAAYAEYDAALDALLTQYEQDMAVGREAAALRNVSKYREWLKAVDALPASLALLDSDLPGE